MPMLTGTFPRTLDDKQRLALPKRLRQSLANPEPAWVYVTPGTDSSLAIYSEAVLQTLADRLNSASTGTEDARAYQRLFYAQAQQIEFDPQGRIRIPSELLKWAGLDNEVVLLGVQDHLELWQKPRWEEYLQRQQARYDQLTETVFGQSRE